MTCWGRRVHVGLVGTGRIGAVHARTLRQSELVSQLTIVDADAGRAAAVAHELSAAQAESPEALLALRVDALVIAAATPAHAELLHLAADASVPTFCEKPIALDLEATDEVIRHVERTGILVQIGFQRRFDAGYRAAREACRAGALGEVHVVHLVTHDPAPPPDAYVAASGGIWRDLAIHDFDIGAWVLDSPITEVFAAGKAHGQVFADNEDVDAASATLRFENGAVGSLSATRNDARGYDVRMEIFGLRDSVAVGWDGRTPLRSIEPGVEAPKLPGYRDFIDRFEPAYRAELQAFLAAVRDGAESACTVSEARDALVVALAADCSLRERRPVRVEEFA
jgi:myo-inositol 2-dehydrogenase / D-chiro-inositol 1-dehydrogenase